MGTMIYYVAALGTVICWIFVLIQMFKDSVVKGILGLLCGLYAFIWGWMNAGRGLRNIMIFWTIAILLGIIGGFFTGFPSALR